MRYKNRSDLGNVHKVGDEIWACAYTESNDKDGIVHYQEPIQGVLVSTLNKRTKTLDSREGSIDFFVPYKKSSKELAWSKVVSASARLYADTREESIQQYNDRIQSYKMYYQKKINKLDELLIRY